MSVLTFFKTLKILSTEALDVGNENNVVELVMQFRQRFVLDDPAFDALAMLIPENALSLKPSSMSSVLNVFPYLGDNVDRQELDSEWRRQALCDESVSPGHGRQCVSGQTAEQFWREKLSARNVAGHLIYPNLRKVTAMLFSLPTSYASVERIFSVLKNVKTDKKK